MTHAKKWEMIFRRWLKAPKAPYQKPNKNIYSDIQILTQPYPSRDYWQQPIQPKHHKWLWLERWLTLEHTPVTKKKKNLFMVLDYMFVDRYI